MIFDMAKWFRNYAMQIYSCIPQAVFAYWFNACVNPGPDPNEIYTCLNAFDESKYIIHNFEHVSAETSYGKHMYTDALNYHTRWFEFDFWKYSRLIRYLVLPRVGWAPVADLVIFPMLFKCPPTSIKALISLLSRRPLWTSRLTHWGQDKSVIF